MDTKTEPHLQKDRDLIDQLGGPTRLAQRLGFDKLGGAQRVSNWRVRGIPASVKVQFPHLFLSSISALSEKQSASSDNERT